MRNRIFLCAAVTVASLGVLWAQEAAAPEKLNITAEQVLEKSIAAAGGAKAFENLKSSYAKATLELPAMGVTADIEIWAKAPNKQLTVTTVEGFGELRQGCDGQTAWSENPMAGLVVLDGEGAAVMRREAVFNAELKWRELYPKVELKGKQKLDERDVYVLEMTPAEGRPVLRYYDSETFHLVRVDMHQPTMQGVNLVTTLFGDYKDFEGRTIPHLMKQNIPEGEVIIKIAEMKSNVEIDDAKFAKPGPPPVAEQK
jgi:hypothetical protein